MFTSKHWYTIVWYKLSFTWQCRHYWHSLPCTYHLLCWPHLTNASSPHKAKHWSHAIIAKSLNVSFVYMYREQARSLEIPLEIICQQKEILANLWHIFKAYCHIKPNNSYLLDAKRYTGNFVSCTKECSENILSLNAARTCLAFTSMKPLKSTEEIVAFCPPSRALSPEIEIMSQWDHFSHPDEYMMSQWLETPLWCMKTIASARLFMRLQGPRAQCSYTYSVKEWAVVHFWVNFTWLEADVKESQTLSISPFMVDT